MRAWYGAHNLNVPLARDATASLLGVDLAHHGLLCRYARGCHEHFDPRTSDSEADLAAAGRRRDHHEVAFHGYHHQPLGNNTWSFTKMFSKKKK